MIFVQDIKFGEQQMQSSTFRQYGRDYRLIQKNSTTM